MYSSAPAAGIWGLCAIFGCSVPSQCTSVMNKDFYTHLILTSEFFLSRSNKSDCCFPSQVRTLARTDEARGLLWLMEEEAVQPGGSEEAMLERLFSYYGSAQGENKGENAACHCLLKHSSEGSPEVAGTTDGTDRTLTSWAE